jgi:hypothetical protein
MLPADAREVPGFPSYRVSRDGSLWSSHIRGSRGARRGPWSELPSVIRKGNLYVETFLCDGGKKRKFRRHELVLLVFVGPRPVGKEARHLNDFKGDNRLDNLCWGTKRENHEDRRRNGILVCGALVPNFKSTPEVERKILRLRKRGLSCYRIAEHVPLSFGRVAAVIRKHLGLQQRLSSQRKPPA